jgi:hypothetical protein
MVIVRHAEMVVLGRSNVSSTNTTIITFGDDRRHVIHAAAG